MKALAPTRPSAAAPTRRSYSSVDHTSYPQLRDKNAFSASHVVQRKPGCACGGGCPRCKDGPGIQAIRRISEPGDRYEREADRVADLVMRMPEPAVQRQVEPEEEDEELIQTRQLSAQLTPLLQRQVGTPEEVVDEEELVQAKYLPGHSISIAAEVAGNIDGAPPQLQRT